MNAKAIPAHVTPLLVLSIVLGGCATRAPDGSREYVGQDGDPAREVFWLDRSGAWTLRHSGPGARPTDEAGRPAPDRTLERPEPAEEERRTATSRAAAPATAPPAAPEGRNAGQEVAAILGDWTLDTEATMRANSMFSDEIKARIKEGLKVNPFDLSVTNGLFVSRGKIETITDRYEVVSVRGNAVTLRLTSPTGREAGRERKVTLIAREGNLAVETAGAMTVILRRKQAPGLETGE